jgi:Kdo2-lipid IVA lauroyltransferase/acyltransferase
MGRRSPFRPIRQRLEARLLAGVGWVARRLPFRAASDLGAGLGHVAHAVLGRRRRIAVENLTRALGDPIDGVPARRVARRAFAQLGRSFVEFLALPALPAAERLERVAFEHAEPIFERQRQGRGLVLVTAHFGNWELLGAAVAARGARVRYLLPPQTNPESDAYLDAVRRRLGIEPVKIGFGMRNALRALRGGDCLGMLVDQDARRVGIHVPFFGRPASTHSGPARLAYRSSCPIGVGIIEREGRGRFRARFGQLLVPDPERGEEEEVRRLTAEVTREIEAAVRRRPDHWYWIHRRWKTPPPDVAA